MDTNSYLLVGGDRNGEEITVATTQTAWTDLLRGETYYKRPIPIVESNNSNGSVRGFFRWAFVHEGVPDNQTALTLLQVGMLLKWARLGQAFDPRVPTQPPASEDDVPRTTVAPPSGLILPTTEGNPR